MTKSASQKRSRGQGMVEFAMTLPLLLILILGIIEFGRLLFVYSSVISAAREAARYGAAGGRIDPNDLLAVNYFRDCDGIRAAAIRVAGLSGVSNSPTGVQIRYDHGPSPTIGLNPTYFPDDGTDAFINDSCPVNGTGPAGIVQGDRIEVTVNAQFHPAQGILQLPVLDISSTVRRSVIINVNIQPDDGVRTP